MDTMYFQNDQAFDDPVAVEMWTTGGERLGPVEGVVSAKATRSAFGPSLIELTAELTAQNSPLTKTDGSIILTVTERSTGTRVEALPANSVIEGSQTGGTSLQVTAAGAYSLIQGVSRIDHPAQPLDPSKIGTRLDSNWGRDTDIRSTIAHVWYALSIEDIPHERVYADQGYVKSDGMPWDFGSPVDELMERDSAGFPVWIDSHIWLPGDEPWEGLSFEVPTACYVMRPMYRKPGLTWTHEGDISRWVVDHSRATATRAVVIERLEGDAVRPYVFVGPDHDSSAPWGRKTVSVEIDEGADPQAAADDLLGGHTSSSDITVELSPSALWKPSPEPWSTASYWTGDIVDLRLPHIGPIERVITDIEIDFQKRRGVTMTPILGDPDKLSTSINDEHRRVERLDRRISRLERGR